MENNQEGEIPTIWLFFVQRSSYHLFPNQPVQFSMKEIITLCLDALLWAFIYFVFTQNFGSSVVMGKASI